jgi:ornithine cyclodeaminase/alanine dehydrogenase-like protein (mu-crystallin family)
MELTNTEIRRLVPMHDAIGAVRDAFRELAEGAFTLPPRLALGDGTVLVMAAHHRPSGTAVVKTLSVELDRVPAILGLLVWSSRAGQYVADAAPITALRTGAIVGVATDAMADPDASTLALFGAGGQAADQVRAVHAVRPLSRVAVHDRDPQRAGALVARLSAELPGIELVTAPTGPEALEDAQIVCCATSSTTPLFDLDALPEHVHVNAIGSFRPDMRELPDKLIATADLLVVDQLEAATEEAGEIIHALGNGLVERDCLHELATVLARSERPVTTGRTVFKTVGIAIQDWAVARLLSRRVDKI